MNVLFFVVIVILVGLLILSLQRNSVVLKEREQLIIARDTALDIANRIVNTRDPGDLYQYILKSCLKLIPQAKFGRILMFDSDGLLTARASVGFDLEDISRFKLRLEDSFLSIATGGKLDHTVIINRLEDLVIPKNVVRSTDQGFDIRSEVSAPLRVNGELTGMLCVDGDQNGIFSEKDIYVLDYMANQIGIVIRNQQLHSEILHLSRYDGLTYMMNRDSFERETEKLLNDPSKDAANLYFVLMDLDELKRANDTVGHHFGDEIIKTFSEIIMKHLGKNDLCGRYGGDEFAAIIQGDHLNVGHLLEEANIEFMTTKIGLLNNDFVHSFSFGMASFQESDLSLDTLYKLADKRMYLEKCSKQKKRH